MFETLILRAGLVAQSDLFLALFLAAYSLCVVLLVAYFTLFERKVMSAIQRRRGPDKVGVCGALQPISDALKLVFKEIIWPKSSSTSLYILSPFLVLFLSFIVWGLIPLSSAGSLVQSDYSFCWILIFSTVNVYSLFLAGYSSSNKYALLGSLRSISQLISYEITLAFLFLPMVFTASSLNVSGVGLAQAFSSSSNIVIFPLNFFLIFICALAETNRAPFDLPEAEAELVAGYNVEYSSLPFAFFFLGEYLNIFTLCVLIVCFFSYGPFICGRTLEVALLSLFYKTFVLMFVFVWVRATMPRVRFDQLTTFSWKFSLLFSFAILIAVLVVHSTVCYSLLF